MYAVLRSAQALDDAAVEVVGRALGPDREELSVWRDGQDPTVLRVSTDLEADDGEGALDAGHALARRALAVCPFAGSVEEVVAMTDEDQLVWRAEP